MYILAIKLDNFADDWDPYNYADAFNDRVNGIENFMTGLKEYPDQIINWLKDIVDECKEWNDPEYEWYMNEANELIKEVTEWISKI